MVERGRVRPPRDDRDAPRSYACGEKSSASTASTPLTPRARRSSSSTASSRASSRSSSSSSASSTSRTRSPASRASASTSTSSARRIGAAFRLIPTEIKTLEELGIPATLHELAEKPRGLVLVTGPTGSGKSTTLAAIIDEINRNALGAHPHDRGPDRVPAPPQALHRQPARDRPRRDRASPRRCARRCARTRT